MRSPGAAAVPTTGLRGSDFGGTARAFSGGKTRPDLLPDGRVDEAAIHEKRDAGPQHVHGSERRDGPIQLQVAVQSTDIQR